MELKILNWIEVYVLFITHNMDSNNNIISEL